MRLIIFLALLIGNIVSYSNPLVIGVLRFGPPFTSEIDNSNHYYGFCIDLMQEICKRINELCEYKATTLDSQMNDIHQGLIDITFLPSPITPTEDKDYMFSLPYLPSTGQFMILNTTNIHSIEELPNKKIGVLQAANLKKNLLSHYTSMDNIHEYTHTTELLNALVSHQVDAILLNTAVARYLHNNAMYNIHLLGQPIELGLGYGIVALKKNAETIEKINTALLQMEADGTYTTIYSKYFGN